MAVVMLGMVGGCPKGGQGRGCLPGPGRDILAHRTEAVLSRGSGESSTTLP